MCITEYNEKTFVDGIKAEGIAEGRIKEIFSCVQDGLFTAEKGAERLNMSLEQFEEEMQKAGYRIPVNV